MTGCTIEFFDSRRLKINIDTLDVTLHLPNKKLGDGAFRLRVLLNCQAADSIRDVSMCTFILDSSLSCRTRLNSCTSCCKKESSEVHPKDFVNSVVPATTINTWTSIITWSKGTHRPADLMSGDGKRRAEELKRHSRLDVLLQ